MKKAMIIAIVIISVLICACVIAAGLFITQNSRLLSAKVGELRSAISACENIKLIETKSVYGKLNGNGNGIDFFGAALLECDSEESVKALCEKLGDIFETAGYEIQTGNEINSKYLEHKKLAFDHNFEPSDENTYYTVFFYDHDDRANPHDPWGH